MPSAQASLPERRSSRRRKTDGKFGSETSKKPRKIQDKTVSNSNVVCQALDIRLLGLSSRKELEKTMDGLFRKKLPGFRLKTSLDLFGCRVTSIKWNPIFSSHFAVASKKGDVVLWDYLNPEKQENILGPGVGGAIYQMKFNIHKPSCIYTASGHGKIQLRDFCGRQDQTFYSTDTYERWMTCIDVNFTSNIILSGDCKGTVVALSRDGKSLWENRLHKQKVTHCEFNGLDPFLFVTASVDRTVKLWDSRMIKDKNSYIHCLPHNKPINSAYFSPDNTQLLTTDQQSDLRIYQAPIWDQPYRTIQHPHRFFQHLTPIKATWHPYHNYLVVGRYPDKDQPNQARTIDFIHAQTQTVDYQLPLQGISSLNNFSPDGNALVSSMGYHTLIFENGIFENRDDKENNEGTDDDDDDNNNNSENPAFASGREKNGKVRATKALKLAKSKFDRNIREKTKKQL